MQFTKWKNVQNEALWLGHDSDAKVQMCGSKKYLKEGEAKLEIPVVWGAQNLYAGVLFSDGIEMLISMHCFLLLSKFLTQRNLLGLQLELILTFVCLLFFGGGGGVVYIFFQIINLNY